MVTHSIRLLLILLAALAVLFAYVWMDGQGSETGFLQGMLAVLLPALIDAGAEAQKRLAAEPIPVLGDNDENVRPDR